MTDQQHSALPPALRRALDLLIDPPADPDISKGFLDLLGTEAAADTPKNTGAIQAVWASTLGSMFYDSAQTVARRLMTAWRQPTDWLDIPSGGVALDVGCGPGNLTAALARVVGPEGLALGVDISEPMLTRAVRAEASPQVGFLRADAHQLPFRDDSFDAVLSVAMLQLAPDPQRALAEMARVLRPGGRMVVMVPTVGGGDLMRLLPNGGARFFDDDELGDIFEQLGLTGVRTKSIGAIQWVRGRHP